MRKKQLLEKLSKAIYITSITSFLFAISVFIYTLSKSNYVSLRKNTETLAQLENKEEMKREIRKEIEQEINNKKLALLSVEPQAPTGPIGKKEPNSKTDNSILVEKEKCIISKNMHGVSSTGLYTGAAIGGATAVLMDCIFSACTSISALSFGAVAGAAISGAGVSADDLTSCDDVMASKLLEQNKEEKPQTH
jgi:hypothetical protein